jgi:hypothetical protein
VNSNRVQMGGHGGPPLRHFVGTGVPAGPFPDFVLVLGLCLQTRKNSVLEPLFRQQHFHECVNASLKLAEREVLGIHVICVDDR